jgi:anti-sigma B factor antagonist
MDIKVYENQGTIIVKIGGRLDTTNYNQLEVKLQEIVDNGNEIIIMNCSEMSYISSSGLRVFLMFLKKIETANGRFVICCLQENIQEIFKISGFNKIFRIFESDNEAMDQIEN